MLESVMSPWFVDDHVCGSRMPTIQKIKPWMESQVLNREIGLCQEMTAGRIGGHGGGSAAESPCNETANFRTKLIFPLHLLPKKFWLLSRASTEGAHACFESIYSA